MFLMFRRFRTKFFGLKKDTVIKTLGLVTLSGMCVNAVSRYVMAGTALLPISAKIIRTLEVTVTASLDFGTLAITDERAGVVRVDPILDRLQVSGGSSITAAGGTPRAGRIKVRGGDKPFTVSVEQSVVALTNGSSTVAVRDFNIGTGNNGSIANITPALNERTVSIPIGATLETKVAQLEGDYVGVTRIFANYQ